MPRAPDPHGLEATTAIDVIFGRCRPDALIAFGSRRRTKTGDVAPHYLFAVTVEDRERWLPAILQHKVNESQYILQNTLSQRAFARGKTIEDYNRAIEEQTPIWYGASNNNVTELAAMIVDLDVGRGPDDLTAWDALAVVMNMTDTGELPRPSLAARSGRGLYLWWLLTDDAGHPPANTPDNLAQWKLITNELLSRCDILNADHQAKNEARWLKRPGTIDTNTGNEVVYSTFGVNHPGAVPRYKLPKLMEKLELHHSPVMVPLRHGKRVVGSKATVNSSPHTSGPTIGNPRAPYIRRLEEIERVAQHRRGIVEGIRETTLFHYFNDRHRYLKMTYRKAGEENADVRAYTEAQQDTRKFAEAYCYPSLSDAEVEQAFGGKLNARPRNDTIRDVLRVTDAEARELGLKVLVTDTVKAERVEAKRIREHTEGQTVIAIKAYLLAGKGQSEIAALLKVSKQRVDYHKQKMLKAGELVQPDASQEHIAYSK